MIKNNISKCIVKKDFQHITSTSRCYEELKKSMSTIKCLIITVN